MTCLDFYTIRKIT